MWVALKRFGFLSGLLALTVLSACSAFRKPDKFEGYYINNIPGSAEIDHANYDLTFSLGFFNRIEKTEKDKSQIDFGSIHGTGWLIDWKEVDKKDKKANKFTVYLATNLHVIQALKNREDHPPYNQFDINFVRTVDFRIGKYTDVKQFVAPSKLGLPNSTQAFVAAQPTVLPKTAFIAHDFVNYTLSKDQKNKKQREQQWKVQIKPNKDEVHPYADSAVLELPLFLNNSSDRQIFDHFIQPAIRAYKQLGDSLNIFAYPTLDQFKHSHYYVLGYPYIAKKLPTLFVNQTGKEKTVPGETAQIPNDQPFVSTINEEGPHLGRIKSDKFNGGTWAWNHDNIKNFPFNRQFRDKEYQMYGKGIGITNGSLSRGASGSLVLNNKRQIVAIYFASRITETQEWGLAQLLRWKPRSVLNEEKDSVAYDLIFGNSNTKKYYAQFAKK